MLAEALKGCTSLRTLMLGHNFLVGLVDDPNGSNVTTVGKPERPEAIRALAGALTINTTLQSLCLKDNCLGPMSATTLAAAVPNWGSLNTLNLAGEPLDMKYRGW